MSGCYIFRFQFILLLSFFFSCIPEHKPNTSISSTSSEDTVSFSVQEVPPLPQSPHSKEMPTVKETESISYKIIKVENPKGFGYDIFVGEKRFLHQPNVPAISGIHSFHTHKDAEKVATLVTYKIKKNIMPPSVSLKELDSLGISQK